MALRYGQLTWAYQFGQVLLDNRFEIGDWDTGVDEMTQLDAPGFYGGWHLGSLAMRSAFPGRLDEARARLSAARELIGTDTSQGVAGMSVTEATVEFAAGEWAKVAAAAREAWTHIDAVDVASSMGAAAAVAANDVNLAREALQAHLSFERRGRLVDASRRWLEAAVALLEEDWASARAAYLSARGDLSAGSSKLTLALLELSVGQRGKGKIPEAADADAAAREFFRSRGAQPFLDRYDAAFVRTAAVPSRPTAAESESVSNKT
ncbi:MAG TPA: hypothetical protein VIK08_01940 [Candidatus Limnocylindrales bacterium]